MANFQKRVMKFMKGLRYVIYESVLCRFRLFSLAHRRIRGDLTCMFKIAGGLLDIPWGAAFSAYTSLGRRGHTFKVHQHPTPPTYLQRSSSPARHFTGKTGKKWVNTSHSFSYVLAEQFYKDWTKEDFECHGAGNSISDWGELGGEDAASDKKSFRMWAGYQVGVLTNSEY